MYKQLRKDSSDHCAALQAQVDTLKTENQKLRQDFDLSVDIFQRKFLKQLLGVKMSTCNVMVYGEFGQIPLSCDLLCNSFIYYHRLLNMPSGSLVKYVFDEMIQLNAVGYSSWVTKVEKMALLYNIDFESHDSNLKFKKACRKAVTQNFRAIYLHRSVMVVRHFTVHQAPCAGF